MRQGGMGGGGSSFRSNPYGGPQGNDGGRGGGRGGYGGGRGGYGGGRGRGRM